MSRGEQLWAHFHSADLDRDMAMDTREWIEYINRETTGNSNTKWEKNRYEFVQYRLMWVCKLGFQCVGCCMTGK